MGNVRVEPFQPYHLELLRAQGVQREQQRELSIVPAAYASIGAPAGPKVTAFDGDKVILCGGIALMQPATLEHAAVGQCWAVLAERASRHMQWLHYATKRFITMDKWRRLEASVEKDFRAGCRWVELLGFEYEGEMRGYGSNGETHLRYARVSL
jgi:hypothetical protein